MPKVNMFQEYPEVAGVFVGGCVLRGDGSSFYATAHAHMAFGAKKLQTQKQRWQEYYEHYNPTATDEWIDKQVQNEVDHIGWICVRSKRRLYNAKGEPSNVMKHELAHILTGKGHTQEWANKLRELGGQIPKGRYKHVK